MKPLLLACTALPLLACAGETFTCPDYLALNASPLTGVSLPADARALVAPGRVWLSGASLFDGPPEEQASLVPDNADSDGPSLWTLASSSPSGYWLSCDYANGLVRITRQLAANSSRCTATASPAGNPADSVKVRFDCQ